MRFLPQGLVMLAVMLGVVVQAESGYAGGDDGLLREVVDLRAEAARGKPILVEFALSGCRYCRVAEEEFLKPMIRSGAYEDRVLIRRLRMERGVTVVDFDGREIAARALAARYGAYVAPTIVVLGPGGELLSEPVVGLTTVDFYGGYLERAIDEAVDALKSRSPAELAAAPHPSPPFLP